MNYIYKALLNPLKKNRKEFDTSKSIEDVFSFEFEEGNYSDRILVLEIIDDAVPAKAIHISSSRLIGRSPFFRELFSNGMRESKQKQVTLRIEASEEVPFTNLLRYVYSNNLPTAESDLLNLLVIADKYDVASCMKDCTQSLQNLLTTFETALLYLDLPPNLAMFWPLKNAAKQFLVAKFKDFHKTKKEMFNLPLLGIQGVVSSDDLQVTSEHEVSDAILKWQHKHYPNSKERRDILEIHLFHLVRCPFMKPEELPKRVQTCDDIVHDHASKISIRTLSFKIKPPHQKFRLPVEVASRRFVPRTRTRHLIVSAEWWNLSFHKKMDVTQGGLKAYLEDIENSSAPSFIYDSFKTHLKSYVQHI